MATSRVQTSTEGALLELIARGEKDKYFLKDDKDSVNPFTWKYNKYPDSIPEIRRTVPITAPFFGGRVDWDLDLPGDILTEASITIELPSWIPPEIVALNKNTLIKDTDNNSYGYVNGIAYFLFKKIQFYQDNILIQEFTGDSLYINERSEGTWNSGFLQDTLRGIHDGTPLSIQRNATPERLVLNLPLPGCQQKGVANGLPICALRSQSFRLRVWLRSINDIIESTGPSTSPFNKQFTYTKDGLEFTPFKTLDFTTMAKPTLFLETKQLYLTNEDRNHLVDSEFKIPFRTTFQNNFTLNSLDYSTLRNTATVPFVTRILDANYTVEQLIVAFRSSQALNANQLWNFANPGEKSFYGNLQVTIAGQIREGPWSAFVWNTVVPYRNNERDSVPTLSYINWSCRHDTKREPTGGINFTTADRPTLYITTVNTPIDPTIGGVKVQYLCIAESWALYVIHKRRGLVAFAN